MSVFFIFILVCRGVKRDFFSPRSRVYHFYRIHYVINILVPLYYVIIKTRIYMITRVFYVFNSIKRSTRSKPAFITGHYVWRVKVGKPQVQSEFLDNR